ncbi:MAG: 50S ribosomal protein L1 [Candidatus Thermoplasmatota archaeon]|nr:50S ribosomal protein L1 [Candidatus Thermoplasmatota archaeon]MCL5955843.1 50S ribosomal protein L1 [Candidatus Thermoplasmatota archaeon]
MASKKELLAQIDQVKSTSKERKFNESIELAINMKEIDLSDPKNRINEEIPLPKGRGKDLKVAVIGTQEMTGKAKGSADFLYGPEDLGKFGEDKKAFKKLASQVDYFVAESTLMANIGKSLGQVLGPRGKIPKPLPPGQDPSGLIVNLKRTVRARSRDKKTFHVPVGTRQMDSADVAENINAVIRRIVGKLEKGYGNIDSIYIKTTMGKPVKLSLEVLE